MLEQVILEANTKKMKCGILVIGSTIFLKIETTTIRLHVGCLAEGIAYLCAMYFIINLEYPPSTKYVFVFFERVFSLPFTKGLVSRIQFVSDFVTKLQK